MGMLVGARTARAYRRFFSSSRGKKIVPEVVPFRISQEDARRAFRAWAKAQPLAPTTIQRGETITAVRQMFLPFYAFDCTVTSRYAVEVGTPYTQWTWQGGPVREQRMRWQKHTGTADPVRYASHTPEMQVLGSFSFKRDLAIVSKVPLNEARPLDSRTTSQHDKEFAPFEMHTTFARDRVVETIRLNEARRLKSEIGQAELRGFHCVSSISHRIRHVYLPCHVVEYTRFGWAFRVFISGYSGELIGQEQYSGLKVTGALLAPLTGLGLWGTTVAQLPLYDQTGSFMTSWLGAILFPAALAGVGAQFFPFVRHYQRTRTQRQEAAHDAHYRQNETSGHSGSTKFRDFFKQYQQGKRKPQQRSQHPSQHREYYDLLGVAPDASLDEIKAGFRKRALEWHPDMQSDEAKKKAAHIHFQKVLQAYQTLRHPEKRRAYDLR